MFNEKCVVNSSDEPVGAGLNTCMIKVVLLTIVRQIISMDLNAFTYKIKNFETKCPCL